jgi:DNA-binding SARP family transcriptional activator
MFVDVRLLGPLQVVDRSGQTIEVAGELPKALLAVLALEAPTPVSSDRIVDVLWGEEPPDSPEASLHSTVSRLRHALGKDIIKRVADSYLLEN